MGTICGTNRTGGGDGRPSHGNDASFSSEMKSASLSITHSIIATELGPVSARPTRPAHTRAATERRRLSAQAQPGQSMVDFPDAPAHPSPRERTRKGGKEEPAAASASASGTDPKGVSHTAGYADDEDVRSQSSTSRLSARRQRALRARGVSMTREKEKEREKTASAAKGAKRRSDKKKKHHHRKATSGVATPQENPSRSLESSQVLLPPPSAEETEEMMTPPAPTNRMRVARLSTAQTDAAAATAASAEANAKEKATEKEKTSEAEKATTAAGAAATAAAATSPKEATSKVLPTQEKSNADVKKAAGAGPTPKPRPYSIGVSPPPPPPFYPPTRNTAASPSPASANVFNSLSHSSPFFAEAAGSHQFSDQGFAYPPSASVEATASDQPSFEYENGYGMFFIDAGDHERGSSSGSEGSVNGAKKPGTSSSPPTTPKAGKLLSRRNRRASFVSFGGEVRLN